MIAGTIAIYFTIVVALGYAASKRAGMGAEDFFLAGRSFGPVVLFVAFQCQCFAVIDFFSNKAVD